MAASPLHPTPDPLVSINLARRLWSWWKRVGRKIGDFQARVLLSVFYYSLFAPFAIGVRWLADPLGIKGSTTKGWQVRGADTGSPVERATRQF